MQGVSRRPRRVRRRGWIGAGAAPDMLRGGAALGGAILV
jgi:hypothetical protein